MSGFAALYNKGLVGIAEEIRRRADAKTATDTSVVPAANDVGPTPWVAELERARQLVHDLRNPVGSVGMAVSMLLDQLDSGPLQALEGRERQLVESTLLALDESAKQLRHLVHENEGGSIQVLKPQVAEEVPAAKPRRKRPQTRVELDGLLRRLEVLTVTRSSLPALLAVDTVPGVAVLSQAGELLRGLSNLVENGIEASARFLPGASPWTVELEVGLDGADVVISVRNRGEALSPEVQAWLDDSAPSAEATLPSSKKEDGGLHGVGLKVARRVAEESGGSLIARYEADQTTFVMRIPALPTDDQV